ncbi:MAG: hypothetical protein HYR96_11520 [Deltaproteobacteria bacterium]|nr:hypothetical protein [Deltaproteobacteria bacterium]MBI3293923.1 hypothetical protein [Deltaproteobacteria bacterium]
MKVFWFMLWGLLAVAPSWGEVRAPESIDWRPIELPAPDLEPLKKIVTVALTEKATSADVLKEADAHYYLGKYEKNSDDAEKHFEIAVDLAAQVLAREPKNPAAIVQWCSAKGALAQMRSPFIALGYIAPIEQKFLELKEIAPAFESYLADRALGRLYQVAPSFISIGSNKKARLHLRAAVDGDPDSPANQIYWAEFLADQGEKSEARQWARKVLVNPKLLTSGLERYQWVKMASALLEKLGPEAK